MRLQAANGRHSTTRSLAVSWPSIALRGTVNDLANSKLALATGRKGQPLGLTAKREDSPEDRKEAGIARGVEQESPRAVCELGGISL